MSGRNFPPPFLMSKVYFKMKNFFVVMAALFCMCMPACAEGTNVEKSNESVKVDPFKAITTIEEDKRNFNFENENLDSANQYFGFDKQTLNLVKEFHAVFVSEMKRAGEANTLTERNAIVNGALNYITKHIAMVVEDKKQYHRFYVTFNTTLQNRGFARDIANF